MTCPSSIILFINVHWEYQDAKSSFTFLNLQYKYYITGFSKFKHSIFTLGKNILRDIQLFGLNQVKDHYTYKHFAFTIVISVATVINKIGQDDAICKNEIAYHFMTLNYHCVWNR